MRPELITGEIPGFYGKDLDWVPAMSITDPNPGNLRLTASGDLATVEGPRLVIQSRVRELLTPYGFCARYVRDYTGVKLVDADYGNPVYLILSDPLNEIPLEGVAAACQYVMLKDSRVANARVTPDVVPDVGLILLRIEFTLVTGEQGQLELTLNPPI